MHVGDARGLEEAKLIRALLEHDDGRSISIHHASDSYAVLFDLSDAVR